LAPYLEPYSDFLAGRGYSQVSFWKKTFLVSEFSRWLAQEHIPAEEITCETEAAFLQARSVHRCPIRGERLTLSALTDWLRQTGVIESLPAPAALMTDIDRVLMEYTGWLGEERGLTPATIDNYASYVRRFLIQVSGGAGLSLASLRAGHIEVYLRQCAPTGRTFASAKHVTTALRSFFRFARYRDYIRTDLAATVPSVAGWSMASIPRAMPAAQVRRLLDASRTWATPAGLRNRAILLLLARLGLRAGEVVRLALEDIDWKDGCLRVPGKGRTQRPLPLPHDVGEAITTYLKHGRPDSACRKVFLRSRAPFDGLKSHSDISQMVARAIARAGIETECTGAHQLRHALAVEMLQQGATLTDIGQVLRHRSPETTRQYAKVDLAALREVALPWPEARP
jgi:site-specific recombinase XerD